ncbi:hypothetical protein F0U63_23755 [Cystobacter fuscus]|nr:hypothetical protein F0U63_23755 [Cystobacter fuscus]
MPPVTFRGPRPPSPERPPDEKGARRPTLPTRHDVAHRARGDLGGDGGDAGEPARGEPGERAAGARAALTRGVLRGGGGTGRGARGAHAAAVQAQLVR